MACVNTSFEECGAPKMFNLGGHYFVLNLYFSVPVLELRKKPTKALRASSADDDKAKLKVSFYNIKKQPNVLLLIILFIIIIYNVGLELITPLRKQLLLRILFI